MDPLPSSTSSPQREPQPDVRVRPAMEETVYRMVTVGAILLVLGTLWVF
jgi:hypothetical protein